MKLKLGVIERKKLQMIVLLTFGTGLDLWKVKLIRYWKVRGWTLYWI